VHVDTTTYPVTPCTSPNGLPANTTGICYNTGSGIPCGDLGNPTQIAMCDEDYISGTDDWSYDEEGTFSANFGVSPPPSQANYKILADCVTHPAMADLVTDEADITDGTLLNLTKFVAGTMLPAALQNDTNYGTTDVTDLAYGRTYPNDQWATAYDDLYNYEVSYGQVYSQAENDYEIQIVGQAITARMSACGY
jgi:hypothetical protein